MMAANPFVVAPHLQATLPYDVIRDFAPVEVWEGVPVPPHQPIADLGLRESLILGAIVVAVFAMGLFPNSFLQKTEVAARDYQHWVMPQRTDEVEP